VGKFRPLHQLSWYIFALSVLRGLDKGITKVGPNTIPSKLRTWLELTGVPAQLLDVQFRMEHGIADIIHASGGYYDTDGDPCSPTITSTFGRPGRTQFVEWGRQVGLWGPDMDSTSLCLQLTEGFPLVQMDGLISTPIRIFLWGNLQN
jgi:hypothetical protein